MREEYSKLKKGRAKIKWLSLLDEVSLNRWNSQQYSYDYDLKKN